MKVRTISTPVWCLTGKPRKITAQYPVLLPSEWVRCIFENYQGKVLLAGHCLDDENGFRSTFSEFWQRFRNVRPTMEIFDSGYDLSLAVPLAVHGDEGRGKLKRPVMVTAVQPLISWKGPSYTNASG